MNYRPPFYRAGIVALLFGSACACTEGPAYKDSDPGKPSVVAELGSPPDSAQIACPTALIDSLWESLPPDYWTPCAEILDSLVASMDRATLKKMIGSLGRQPTFPIGEFYGPRRELW